MKDTKEKLFRFHRGSLKESMETVISVKNVKQLISKYNQKYQEYKFPPLEKIVITSYGYDKRIDWETYIVEGIFNDGDKFVIGFTNGELK